MQVQLECSLLKNSVRHSEISEGWTKIFMHFDNPIDYLIWNRENSAYKAVYCDEIIEQEI